MESNEKHFDESAQPMIQIIRPPEPTASEKAWAFLSAFVATLTLIAVGAYIVMLAWNSLIGLSVLPEIGWRDAFAALWIVRVAGAVFNQ